MRFEREMFKDGLYIQNRKLKKFLVRFSNKVKHILNKPKPISKWKQTLPFSYISLFVCVLRSQKALNAIFAICIVSDHLKTKALTFADRTFPSAH